MLNPSLYGVKNQTLTTEAGAVSCNNNNNNNDNNNNINNNNM
jgi:hypothetical protein